MNPHPHFIKKQHLHRIADNVCMNSLLGVAVALASIAPPCRGEDNDNGSGIPMDATTRFNTESLYEVDDDYTIPNGNSNLGAYIGGGIAAFVVTIALVLGSYCEYKANNKEAKIADEHAAAASASNVTVDVGVEHNGDAEPAQQLQQQQQLPPIGVGGGGGSPSVAARNPPYAQPPPLHLQRAPVSALKVDQSLDQTSAGVPAPAAAGGLSPHPRPAPGGFAPQQQRRRSSDTSAPPVGAFNGPSKGPNQVRGICSNCGKPVLVSQPRETNPDGSYYHTNPRHCPKVPAQPAQAQAAHAQ